MVEKVRAKFYVADKHYHHNGNHDADQCGEVRLVPVHANNADNAQWSKYTPSGEIKMLITNPEALEAFELGEAYFVDFTPAR